MTKYIAFFLVVMLVVAISALAFPTMWFLAMYVNENIIEFI